MNFKNWMENKKTIPCGDCFRFATQEAENYPNATIVHGTVTAPFSQPPNEYAHAWIESDGIVYDWQTMKAGHGGNFQGKGYPLDVFNELYKPKNELRYTPEEATINALRHKHWGPWEGTIA